ncbi:hypothetical protein Celaphus_00017535 [Cervus elaphus hippelaphus]|uniref:Uncharacterized protein n=1 Tax=Cervus elaphus hippelaphus TaxID=46360 RepID=A0A212D652_CEREH|nr:hypothetical protein Celaphus_00017535 [Cervus elaphus hippelaphus]
MGYRGCDGQDHSSLEKLSLVEPGQEQENSSGGKDKIIIVATQDGPVIKVWEAKEEGNNILHHATTCPSLLELAWDGNVDNYLRVCKQGLMEEKEQKATELLAVKYKAVESELLLWGKNIMNHTKERQKTLKLKSEEIAEQKYHGQEIQQEVVKAEIWDQHDERIQVSQNRKEAKSEET